MIRTYNKQTVVVENGVTKYLADIFCNSTDTKPTANLVNGSKLTEVDTGKTYLFDEANTEWVEYSAGGGGTVGGGLPYLETITIENTLYGLVVHNMNENMTGFSNIVENQRGTFLSPSIIAEAIIADCDDVETDLQLSNLVTYNSDGTTETYQGKHRVYVATKWFEISGFNMIAMASIQTSSDDIPLLLDIDTGKMVYHLGNS